MSCLRCGSINTVKHGLPKQRQHGTVQPCKCKHCGKNFTLGSEIKPAQSAGECCFQCGSSNTVKVGKLQKSKHSTIQACRCNDCGGKFNQGGRKKARLYFQGKEVCRFWNPPGLKHIADIKCPDCSQEKAVLKTEFWDSREKKKARVLACLNCGRKFKGEGRPWKTGVQQMMGKKLPRHPWQFEDDSWDLRELYSHCEDNRLVFLNFNNRGTDWFKNLLKAYIIHLIKRGNKLSSLPVIVSRIGVFGRYLEEQKIILIEEVDRQLLATYWEQKRSHLTRNGLNQDMGFIKNFLDWGNAEQYFTTSSTLITSFDRPKTFHSEPDPLEDFVLEAIRDNVHRIVPKPLQLMFILGFWLGTRPNELCCIRKDSFKLDPDGSTWWVEFKREKVNDEHKLPITTDLIRLIQQQQSYINNLFGEDYPYLFCHYQGIGEKSYPDYSRLKPIKRPPLAPSGENPMNKAIRHLISQCDIRDSNGNLVHFTGGILRPTRATYLIRNGYSLEFVRIWLKHSSAVTTKRHYIRYRPGELLDVACVMANMGGKFYAYDSNPESLRQNLDLHNLEGLKMLNGEPLYGYCIFREFCPRFGHCYTCGYHVASADKLPHYKAQLERLLAKKSEVFNYGSSEILESYTQIVNALESKIELLENSKT